MGALALANSDHVAAGASEALTHGGAHAAILVLAAPRLGRDRRRRHLVRYGPLRLRATASRHPCRLRPQQRRAGPDRRRLVGAARTFAGAVVAEGVALVLLALAPGTPGLVAFSAVLFGVGYNVAVAVEAMWSAQVFAGRPSAGLAAVMFLGVTGLLLGPPLAGFLADQTGMRVAFAAGAALLGAMALLAPRGGAMAAVPEPA